MRNSLPVVNARDAKFDCIFGRGCDGLCCKNGRPSLYPEDLAAIEGNLDKFLPHLRPAARALIERAGFLSKRKKFDMPMLRVVDGWCVFFHEGCVFHKVGAAEGDPFRYKPAQCALFPLAKNDHDEWYVRQWGYEDEDWDLFCLNPKASGRPAVDSLRGEIDLAARYDAAAREDLLAKSLGQQE